MAGRHEGRHAIEDGDRSASSFDWEVSIARARQRAVALRSSHGGDTKDVDEAAYDELALSFEELTVAQEELRTRNDQVTDATARIEEARRRYHELFLAAPVPYIVTDKHGVIREVNHAASRLLRRNADALSGKPLAVFVDDTSRRRVRRAICERGTSPGTSSIWRIRGRCREPDSGSRSAGSSRAPWAEI